MENSGERIVLNISGTKFEILSTNLDKLPVGRLANLHQENHYVDNEGKIEYYFHRDPEAFSAISNFYGTGKLHLPQVC